jgi:anti-sigma B factor antagonist
MLITQWSFRDAAVLDMHGILMGPQATDLLAAAVRRAMRTGARRVVLNLGDVPSIDAAGLGALVAAYGVVKRRGGTLRLARAARRVHALLVMCRLVTIFETFDSVEAAVADRAGPGPDSSPMGSRGLQLSTTSLEVIQHFLRRA